MPRAAGRDPPAAEDGGDVGQRLAHDLQRERRGRCELEGPIAVEEVPREQAASRGELGDAVIGPGVPSDPPPPLTNEH